MASAIKLLSFSLATTLLAMMFLLDSAKSDPDPHYWRGPPRPQYVAPAPHPGWGYPRPYYPAPAPHYNGGYRRQSPPAQPSKPRKGIFAGLKPHFDDRIFEDGLDADGFFPGKR